VRTARGGLAFAVVAPPAAWTAQLLAAYLLVSLACAKHLAVPFGVEIVGAVAAGAALAGLATALRARDRVAPTERFVAHVAALAAALFLVGIVLGTVPGIVLSRCG
jgi:hypothetical protein